MTIHEQIEAALKQLDWTRAPQGLYEPIGYTLEAGGKRLRPSLCLMAAALYDADLHRVMPAALALEVFHNFTLLHDDVMDHASVRRGRPTVHVRWDENTAILSGDQMLIEAYKLLSQLPADKLPRILELFNEMATQICEGQQYDVDFEREPDTTIDDYLMMIRLKTSVLLAYALKIGAYLASAPQEEQDALFEYGINLGIAFQLQDDILDVYGDPATFGKATGGDICENKKTYMLLSALQNATDEEQEELLQWMSLKDFDPTSKICAVTRIYNRIGVRNICEGVMRNYTQKALASLSAIHVDDSKKQIFRDLANKLLGRKE